jgi:hypothetical protein
VPIAISRLPISRLAAESCEPLYGACGGSIFAAKRP